MSFKHALILLITTSGITLIVSCGSKSEDNIPLSGTATATDSSAAEALLNQARSHESAGKQGKALSIYKAIFKKYPYTRAASEARFSEGRILDREGSLLKAFEAYQDVISRYPESRHYATAINRQESVAHAAADGIIKNSFLGMKTKVSAEKTEKMLRQVRNNAPRAASASKAQFAIGRLWQQSGSAEKSIPAYQRVSLDYPDSPQAPEALYQTGEILVLKAERGNQNTAHVNRARDIYNELVQRYPGHKRANDARKRIAMLGGQDVQRSYETAEFYRKKGNTKSAIFYYREVLRKTKSGNYHNLAKQRIAELGGS